MAKKAPKPFDDVKFKNTARTVKILDKVNSVEKGMISLHKMFAQQMGVLASASGVFNQKSIGRSLVPVNNPVTQNRSAGANDLKVMSAMNVLVENLGAKQVLFQNATFDSVQFPQLPMSLPGPVAPLMPIASQIAAGEEKKVKVKDEKKEEIIEEGLEEVVEEVHEWPGIFDRILGERFSTVLTDFKEIRKDFSLGLQTTIGQVMAGPFGEALKPLQNMVLKFITPNFMKRIFGFGVEDKKEVKMRSDIAKIEKYDRLLFKKQFKEDIPKELRKLDKEMIKNRKETEGIHKGQKMQTMMFLGPLAALLIPALPVILGVLGAIASGLALWKAFPDTLKQLWKDGIDGIKTIFDTLKPVLKQLWADGIAGMKTLWGEMKEGFDVVKTKIGEFIDMMKPIVAWLGGVAKQAAGGFKELETEGGVRGLLFKALNTLPGQLDERPKDAKVTPITEATRAAWKKKDAGGGREQYADKQYAFSRPPITPMEVPKTDWSSFDVSPVSVEETNALLNDILEVNKQQLKHGGAKVNVSNVSTNQQSTAVTNVGVSKSDVLDFLQVWPPVAMAGG